MKRFTCEIRTPGGTTTQIIVSARNRDSLADIVDARGFTLLRAEEHRRGFSIGKPRNQGQELTNKELLAFFRQMRVLVSANLSLKDAFREISETTSGPVFGLAQALCAALTAGRPLGPVFRRYLRSGRQWMYADLMEIAADSGDVSTVILDIEALLKNTIRVRKRILTASLYPGFVMALSGVALAVMLFVVMPRLEDFATIVDPSVLNRIQTNLRLIMVGVFTVTFGALAAVLLPRMRTNPNRTATWMSRASYRVPVISGILRSVERVRLYSVYTVFLQAGTGLPYATSAAYRMLKLGPYGDSLNSLGKMLERGDPPSPGNIELGSLPRPFLLALSGARNEAQLLSTIRELSEEEKPELDENFDRALALVEPLFITSVGVIVFLLAFFVVLPLYQSLGGAL